MKKALFCLVLLFCLFKQDLSFQADLPAINQEAELSFFPTQIDATEFSCVESLQDKPQIKKVAKKDYYDVKPYSDYKGFVKYFGQTALKYEKVHGVSAEFILAKAWQETNGGLKGVGKKGNWFGIKGENRRSFSAKDDQYEGENRGTYSFKGYGSRWETFSDFCKFVKKPLYATRYKAWKKVCPTCEDFQLWALSLQVHPQLSKSKLAYASCNCKDGRQWECYSKRRDNAGAVVRLSRKASKLIRTKI